MSDAAAVERLQRACVEAGEAPPFSDQTLVDIRAGRGRVVAAHDAAAAVHGDELELAVFPGARRHGIGGSLLRRVLAETNPPTLAWAHGDHPAARRLAERVGWMPARTLLQLRAPLPAKAPAVDVPDDYTLHSFSTGADTAPSRDEQDWLALNAEAFSWHPEQGSMTLDDLRARERETWFSGEDLLLLRDRNRALAGSCWLKATDGIGEFYAVAVRPDLQGHGLGGLLMRAGFARLAGRGLEAAALYVEGDNVPALALYRRSGFTVHTTDIQYRAG